MQELLRHTNHCNDEHLLASANDETEQGSGRNVQSHIATGAAMNKKRSHPIHCTQHLHLFPDFSVRT
jgi:hypothetical protein